MKKLFLICFLLFSFTIAKKPVSIGSGGKTGNYFKVAQDIVDFCAKDVKSKFGYDLINVSTKGSVDNLNGILKKKYSIGFVQEDVYQFFKKRDQLNVIDMNTLRLMYLYPEYLTILIPKNWHPKATDFLSKLSSLFNKNEQVSIMSLKNQTVYAKGGALISAQALSFFLGLNLNIIDADTHKVDGPFIFVTGSGDSRIQKMLDTDRWFLLSFNGTELANRVNFYKPAVVTYIVKGKSITANTVSIMSVAYARKYRGKAKREAVNYVRECVKNNIDDLIDDGSSDKWSLIVKTNGWSE